MTHKLKSRLVLVFLFAICASPFVGAYVWYTNSQNWRPASTGNNGTLITPPVEVHAMPLPLLDGGTLPENWFYGDWTLVYAGPSDCPTLCKKALYLTRQVRLTMGGQMIRVQRLFIVMGTPDKPKALRRAHPKLTVVNASSPLGQQFLSQFETATDVQGRQIWLVDRQARLMMVYPLTDPDNGIAVATGIAEDLHHLLKY